MNLPAPRFQGLELRYGCQLERLPKALRARFLQLGRDSSLDEYLERAERARHGGLMTALHRMLRGYLSDFEINGLLGTYPMHVLGTRQWQFLLDSASAEGGLPTSARLLDVGAGNGDVSVQLAPLFAEVVTTELARSMAWRLRRRGFVCHRLDVAQRGVPDGPYDVIACLNVLDRCDRPLSLLGNLRAGLRDQGLLIVALVLPYQPFVYDGAGSRAPRERLALTSTDWESAAEQFCTRVIEPLGLSVASLSRAPYLSGGDARRGLYELDDLVVVARAQGRAHLL